jgi:transcriptional regulator PpsR
VNHAPKGPVEAPDLGVLSDLAPQLAQTFVSIASDIALVVDAQGVIRSVAVGHEPISGNAHDWVGKAWTDTVSGDTRRKVELLLSEARTGAVTQRREVNHRNESGHDIPVAYAAVRLGRDGPVLAVGRDLRAVSAIQQRFIDAQQAMERDYWRQRQAEARYRMLFQVATDGVLVVDAATLQVLEANRAASMLFGRAVEALTGQPATAAIAPSMRAAVEELFITARTSGRPGEIRAMVAPVSGPAVMAPSVDISATPFRADDVQLLLVRARSAESLSDPADAVQRLADFVERTPDAVVITDSHGRVLMANPAFTTLCQDASRSLRSRPTAASGHALIELLGDPKGQLPSLLSEARLHGIAEQRAVSVGHASGASLDVEISAALLAEGDQECLGLTLRRVDQRLAGLPPQVGELATAIDRLAAQVGIVSLPELMRETSELAERHLIEAALARTHGDRLQAAQLLGIDAENLWLRMRHHAMDKSVTDGKPPGLLN